MNKQFTAHESGIWVAEDGEVFVPKSGANPAHYTYGSKMNKGGYRVVFYQKKPYYVHRLVGECYIPNPDGKPCIDHINTNRSDNRVENLRWCTYPENSNNPLSLQKMSEAKQGEHNPLYGKHHSEETRQKIAESLVGKKHSEEHIRNSAEAHKKPIIGTHKITGEIVEFESAKDAWLVLNINKSDICSCLKGRLKSAGGYVWYYA